MKLSFFLSLLMLIFIMVTSMPAQTKFAQDFKGEFQPKTLFESDSCQTGGDTSAVLEVPFAVKTIIYYLETTAVSTGDSLSTGSIQVSGDQVHWVASTYSFAEALTTGTQRVVQTVSDRYLRFIFTTRGTSTKIGLKLIAVAK